MPHKIGIFYNESGLRSIMKGNGIAKIEQDIMIQKLNQIQASFFQHFGFEGKFEIKKVDTTSRRSRTTFRIVPTDARTTAALKRESGWLGRFL